MKISRATLIACAAAFAMTSCLDDDTPTQTVQYNLNYNASLVTDAQAAEAAPMLFAGAKYEFEFNVTASKVDVNIKDLQVSPTGARYSFTIADQKYTVDNEGFVVLSIPNATVPTTTGGPVTVSAFKMRQSGATINATQSTVYYDIEYTFNDRYDVRVIQTSNVFNAKVTVTDTETGEAKTSYTSFAGYKIDLEKNVAQVSLGNVNIAGISRSEINFLALPMSLNVISGVQFSPDNASPLAYDYANKEIKDFAVSDFASRLSYLPEMFMRFKVNDKISVEVQASYKSLQPADDNAPKPSSK